MSARNVLKLDEARALTPAVTDVAGCVMRLQGAVFDSVNESDIKSIMGKMKEKALNGDQKAGEFLLNFLANPKVSYTRRDVNVTTRNETKTGNDDRTVDATPASDALATFVRKQAAKLLAKQAPLAIDDLADELELPADVVDSTLIAPWFHRNSAGQVHLTVTGRQELTV